MKYITSIIALGLVFSASSFAAQQITNEEAASYTKLGDLVISQDGLPTIGHEGISKAVDEKCHELGQPAGEDCFYRIIGATGQQTNFKDINIEIFKK